MKDLNKSTCILLLGGVGSRYSNINEPPKQLIKIYKRTLIENILIHLKKNGINNFILPLGYKKDYFYKFFKTKKKIGKYYIKFSKEIDENSSSKNINLNLFDAGKNTTKLTRIKKSLNFVKSNFFFVTYGDGLANIKIKDIYKLYIKTRKSVVSSTKINSQYGHLKTNKINNVIKFVEKPILDMPINIGYYLFNKEFFIKNYLKNSELESEFLKSIVKKKKLVTYLHHGFFFNIDKKIDLVKLKKEKKIFIKDF